ncbi:hypothetical protein HGO38_28825 [Rhizobium sp. CG5]|uniref:hypothetical protein n=1 Tax=Rhizobium sp. CG5 TaxID=2726076 RepID=UPI002033EC65|nr:hypothetical protein [Rhizobium sp. CG5]MCM2477455.1 hypothetical protein [Rhizobium sp. CG5]
MVAYNSMPIPTGSAPGERSLGSAELIDRLAQELRASSDGDLPHSYFVEQAKLQLAGIDLSNADNTNDATAQIRKTAVNGPASVFHAWAMPE